MANGETTLPIIDGLGNPKYDVVRLSVAGKQGSRPARVYANQGHVGGDGSYTTFETVFGGSDCRHWYLDMVGTNTRKNRERYLLAMLERLENEGVIEKGHSVNVD